MFVLVFTAVLLMTLGALGAVVDRRAERPDARPHLRVVPSPVDPGRRRDTPTGTRRPRADTRVQPRDEPPFRHCA